MSEGDESSIPLGKSFLESAICQNCASLIYDKENDCYRCKERTEGDLLNQTNQKTNLNSHCSLFEEAKTPLKGFNKKKKKTFSGILIDNYVKNVEDFYEQQPFFYDESCLFWMWDGYKYKVVDEVDMMNFLDSTLGFMGQTVSSRIKSSYMEAFKRVGRQKKPKEAKKHWIQFRDKAFSLRSGNIYEVTPDYFFTNPIPHELGGSDNTPVMDKLITDWVGEEYKKTAYEILAYCCLADYPIHLVFCLVGSGRNGKSKFLGMLNNFVGKENICSTELDILLESRFESSKLHKKLVASMGETNFGVMTKTSLLKRLVGGDVVGIEYKNKNPFDEINYAKIVIASNSLPISHDDSEGFYRRWLILDFPNIFPEGHDILKTIPDIEYNNLARKITKILPELLKRGKFTNQGTIEERRRKYIENSNPLKTFLKEYYIRDSNGYERYSEVYNNYRKYLHKKKKRRVGYKEFNDILSMEGLSIQRTSRMIGDKYVSDRFIDGITFNSENNNMTLMTDMTPFPLSYPIWKSEWDIGHICHKCHKTDEPIDFSELLDPIYINCAVCGTNPSHFEFKGRYFCKEDCLKIFKMNNTK